MISADDFGKNKTTNQRILSLIGLNVIQRVAILVDGKISPQEVCDLKKSGIKIDIHLSIEKLNGNEKSKQEPLSRVFSFFFNYLLGKYSTRKIRTRWEEQIEAFRNIFGEYPSGLNSHEHVHFFPPYFREALLLGKKFDISYIRLGKNGLKERNTIIAYILAMLWKINQKYFQKSHIDSSGYLISFDWLKDPIKFFKGGETNDIEIVCHPERNAEYEILRRL